MILRKYNEYINTEFEWYKKIPKDWNIIKIRYISNRVLTGSTPPSDIPELFDGDLLWFTPADFSDKLVLTTSVRNIGELAIREGYVKLLPPKTVLIVGIGTIGKVGICNCGCSTNQQINAIVLEEKMIPEFIAYALASQQETLKSISNVNLLGIMNQEKTKQINLPIPSYSEQKVIADFLDYKTSQIDELINYKEKLIGLLEEKKVALITKSVTKGIDDDVKMKPSYDQWIGEIPEHWEVKKLKYIVKIQVSGVDKKTEENEDEILLCNYVDVYKNDYITSSIDFMKATATKREIEKFKIEKGDILVTKDSETPDDIAVPALVAEDFQNVICGYHLAQVKSNVKVLVPKYLFYFFLAKNFNAQFTVAANGITRFGLGAYVFGDAQVPIMAINEQEQIVEYLDKMCLKIDDLIQYTKKAIQKLKEYRSALITSAVTGQIDVRDFRNENNDYNDI